MAAALMTQWLFNFTIAKLTPIMLANITYGTFLLFGGCCVLMGIYVVVCCPETKGVPLESMHHLFEGNIIAGCIRDTVPRFSRAKELQNRHATDNIDSKGPSGKGRKGAGADVHHIEEA